MLWSFMLSYSDCQYYYKPVSRNCVDNRKKDFTVNKDRKSKTCLLLANNRYTPFLRHSPPGPSIHAINSTCPEPMMHSRKSAGRSSFFSMGQVNAAITRHSWQARDCQSSCRISMISRSLSCLPNV